MPGGLPPAAGEPEVAPIEYDLIGIYAKIEMSG
jgi:hypothetical protein